MNKKIKLLSTKQVGEYLGLSVRTVQRLAEQGKIKAVKIGSQWKYFAEDIKKHLNFGTDFSKEPARIPNNPTERRVYPRINCSLPCYIKIVIPQKKEIYTQSRIINISEGGSFLENCNNDRIFLNIKNDDPINLSFKLEENELETDGRVLRNDDNGIAVKFKKLYPNAREIIKEYIG